MLRDICNILKAELEHLRTAPMASGLTEVVRLPECRREDRHVSSTAEDRSQSRLKPCGIWRAETDKMERRAGLDQL